MPADTSTFTAFLSNKGIDSQLFQKAMPDTFARCQREFEVAGPSNLDLSKKFFWNDWRKEFPVPSGQLREE